ncbi:nucleoside diphosphate kinase-like isoform X2 [Lineus longissimus]|uniref:nucleoside diphosphate kinase-like isoform X2 n=1 Tax=Lineus longissimus TaxID=88925 RepID=UPI002B4F067B
MSSVVKQTGMLIHQAVRTSVTFYGLFSQVSGQTSSYFKRVAAPGTCRLFSTTSSTSASSNIPPDVPDPERQKTFVMVKPDGVQRGLVGEVLKRFEVKGYKLRALKFVHAPLWICEEHYIEHRGRVFYPKLLKYIRSGPVVPMVFEGEKVVEAARKIIGETDPVNSNPGTIRGDFGLTVARNVIHGSDSIKSAEREIALWFEPAELIQWDLVHYEWLYEH